MAVRLTAPGKRLVKKPKRMRENGIHWEPVRRLYIEGQSVDPKEPLSIEWPTMARLAELTGIALSTIQTRGARERWVEQKNDYILRIARQRSDQRLRTLMKQSQARDATVLNIVSLGNAIIVRRLAAMARDEETRSRIGELAAQAAANGELIDLDKLGSINPNGKGFESKELLDLATSAEKFDQLANRVFSAFDPAMVKDDIEAQLEGGENGSVRTMASQMLDADEDRMAKAMATLQRIGLLSALTTAVSDDEDSGGTLPQLMPGKPAATEPDGTIDGTVDVSPLPFVKKDTRTPEQREADAFFAQTEDPATITSDPVPVPEQDYTFD